MLDLIIRGGDVVDGTGAPRRRADVGVRDGTIVAIGVVDESARTTIDATGHVVAPGFVDLHTHYDAQIFWDPALTPSCFHGVTTAVAGNCGFTIAPVVDDQIGYTTRLLARVEGIPLEALEAGVPFDWRSMGEYLDRLDSNAGINVGFLVGHCALRSSVMGERARTEPASPAELAAMRELLTESLAAGGLGFSSSTSASHLDGDGRPIPSRAATEDELVELSAAVRDVPGTTLQFIPAMSPHGESHRRLMARMSRAGNRPLNWNLLSPVAEREADAWYVLDSSDHASAEGGYVVGLTTPQPPQPYLSFQAASLGMLPGWAEAMAAPLEHKRALFADVDARTSLARSAAASDHPAHRLLSGWGDMTIIQAFTAETSRFEGRRVADIAGEMGVDAFEALVAIASADDLRTVFAPPPVGDDDASWALKRSIWTDPRAIIGGSDSGAHLDMLSTFSLTTAFLAAARDRNLLPVEQVVHLLTDRPARLYGLRRRGRIAGGWVADLVVFDEERVAPGPVEWRNDLPAGAGRLYGEADGIVATVVNGRIVVRDGTLTGDQAGTVLRSGRDTETVTAAAKRVGSIDSD